MVPPLNLVSQDLMAISLVGYFFFIHTVQVSFSVSKSYWFPSTYMISWILCLQDYTQTGLVRVDNWANQLLGQDMSSFLP